MRRTASYRRTARPRYRGRAIGLLLLLATTAVPAALAGPTARIQGRIVGTDDGQPIGFADVLLIPADTTQRKVGGMTNSDGTFRLEAAPGRYTLQIRAMSYAIKRVEGLQFQADQLLPFDTALTPEAIQQEEIVVEARARQNTEASLLAARKKAAALGDAVSAEQVRRSPDKDAAEVLRRVTGLTVADGKYVFVRGLGERYSSTEVDGVRLASPEQNKRVVPLDLVPANLLENIVVQKTYTADRPGEFGGGDVQVRTKDFPGKRVWSLSISQGFEAGVTFQPRNTYTSSRADLFGFGAFSRRIPDMVFEVAGDRKLALSNDPAYGFSRSTLAGVAKSFQNVWTPTTGQAIPNADYAATFGDEFKLLGRPLGFITSWTMSRALDEQSETQRFYESDYTVRYNYAVHRSTESVRLGGMSGLSYRLSPRHTLHLRGLWTQSADDEVRVYQGPDHNRTEPFTGEDLVHRNTRLMYLERSVLSGSLEGEHELTRLLGSRLNWKFNRSEAERIQPDRRETTYDYHYTYDANGDLVGYWGLGSRGLREYGDLRDLGWGASASASVPYRLDHLGSGKVVVGVDRQTKHRHSSYRRFSIGSEEILGYEAPPESLFKDPSVYVEETTLDQDNYQATQEVNAGYLSVDLPLGSRLRGTFGVRVERGVQDVVSFDLFDRSRITAQGGFQNTDWLSSGNLTWSLTGSTNVRLAASRTLSRPDLNELSPSPTLEYVGGYQQAGNQHLNRALIDNYDARVEIFPTLSEVLAAGFFYKRLHEPIEQTIQGGAPPLLVPSNSDRGQNLGVELEARAALGRLWGRLKRLSLNSNASFISSTVWLKPSVSKLGSEVHPLQGQATYVLNGALTYAFQSGRGEATILMTAAGKRLRLVGYDPLPDVYDQPTATLDVTVSRALSHSSRIKVSAKNLLDPAIRQLQGSREISAYHNGRSYSIAFSYGS